MKKIFILLQLILLFLLSYFCISCSSTIKASDYLPQREVRIIDSTSHPPNLNYIELVKPIGIALESSDTRLLDKSLKNVTSTINQQIISYIAKKSDLTKREKESVLSSYKLVSGDYISSIINTYKKELTYDSNKNESELYVRYPTYRTVRSLSRIISGHVCDLTNIVLSIALGGSNRVATVSLSAVSTSNLCNSVLESLFNPITEKLFEAALIVDHTQSKWKIEKHVRESIIEFATAKDEIVIEYERPYERKFLFIFKSSAKIIIRNSSIVKAGFDLSHDFNIFIDDNRKNFIIELPKPEILSVDSKYEVLDIKNGLFIRVEEDEITEALKISKDIIENRSVNSGIYLDAKENCKKIIEMIFLPVIEFLPFEYELVINFDA